MRSHDSNAAGFAIHGFHPNGARATVSSQIERVVSHENARPRDCERDRSRDERTQSAESIGGVKRQASRIGSIGNEFGIVCAQHQAILRAIRRKGARQCQSLSHVSVDAKFRMPAAIEREVDEKRRIT